MDRACGCPADVRAVVSATMPRSSISQPSEVPSPSRGRNAAVMAASLTPGPQTPHTTVALPYAHEAVTVLLYNTQMVDSFWGSGTGAPTFTFTCRLSIVVVVVLELQPRSDRVM